MPDVITKRCYAALVAAPRVRDDAAEHHQREANENLLKHAFSFVFRQRMVLGRTASAPILLERGKPAETHRKQLRTGSRLRSDVTDFRKEQPAPLNFPLNPNTS